MMNILTLGLSALIFFVALGLQLSGKRKSNFIIGLSALIFLSLSTQYFSHVSLTVFGFTLPVITITSSLWWFNIAYLVNLLIRQFVYRLHLTSDGEPTIPLLLQHLITILIYLIASMIVMRFILNQSITAVATASGAIALVLGYSSRTVLEEVFSGLALYANKPFVKGDLIQLNDEWGYVKDISWRSITYMDMDENYVVVPNTTVAASKIRNLDLPTKMVRRTLFFRAEYNTPPKVVIEECDLAMKECPHIATHPWNFTSFYDFDESGVRYKLHFYINHYDFWYLASDELINAIWYRFARKGIRFAHQRYLNYSNTDDERRGLPGSAYDESNWQDLIARFKLVPMFEGMTTEDMEVLAKSATLHIVGPPERIITSGTLHPSMFLIASGVADVFEVDENGIETWMATVSASETLGLMSLLTGIPQRTTIRAKEEVAVWEISSDSLHALFENKPEIMANIASNVVRWQTEEDEAINAIASSRLQKGKMIGTRTNSLSNRIANFFHGRTDHKPSNEYIEF